MPLMRTDPYWRLTGQLARIRGISVSVFDDKDILARARHLDVPVRDGRIDLPTMMAILASRLDQVQRQAFMEKMSQLDRADFIGRSESRIAPMSQKRPVLN